MGNFSYVISARQVNRQKEFTDEPGKLRFLEVPAGATYKPEHEINATEWVKKVQDAADGNVDNRIARYGDVLIFIHGYNNTIDNVALRQQLLQRDLTAENWRGLVISFDWPSNDNTLNYYEDRWDASSTAMSLITKGIRLIVEGQRKGCQTNIHMLGHSTGAYVIMEAFMQTEKKKDWFQSDWRMGQVALIGADISARSLDQDSDWNTPLFKRIMRLTNYSNGHDYVLSVSNAKRLGVSPRVGRVGLTDGHHPKAVNVNCSNFFDTIDPTSQPDKVGTWVHSWHIGNRTWARDLAMTLEGRIDRNAIPTRVINNGELFLGEGTRPHYEESWLERNELRK